MSQMTTLNTAESQAESRIDKYRRYREMSDDLHSDIVELGVFGKFLHTASVHLGFNRAKDDLFDRPSTDVAIAVDYAEQEVLEHGKSFLEIYRDSTAQHSPEETELLDRWINSPVGLYRIIDSDAEAALVTAEDVMDPSHHVTMTDFGLSMSHKFNKIARPNDPQLSFLRPIQFEDFAMCSGFICAFPPSMERELLKLWQKYDGPIRYASIVRLFKAKGDPTISLADYRETMQ